MIPMRGAGRDRQMAEEERRLREREQENQRLDRMTRAEWQAEMREVRRQERLERQLEREEQKRFR